MNNQTEITGDYIVTKIDYEVECEKISNMPRQEARDYRRNNESFNQLAAKFIELRKLMVEIALDDLGTLGNEFRQLRSERGSIPLSIENKLIDNYINSQ